MVRVLARLVLVLLCLSLTRPACGGTDAASAPPPFTGTFLQLLAGHADWDPGRWEALFAALAAIGVGEVVVQWSVIDATPTYPSRHFTAPAKISLPAVLEAARRHGLRLVLGLVHEGDYWTRIERDPKLVRVHFRRLLRDGLATARELLDLAGDNPALAGFYIPQEIDDRNWLDPQREKVLAEYLGDLTRGLHALAPGLPVAVSGFSNAFAEPELLGRFWQELLVATDIDRVLFQDGVGVGKLRPDEAEIFLAAVSRAAAEAGRRFTPVVETFSQVDGPPLNDKPFRAEPAPLARLADQLRQAGRVPHDGIVAFSLPEYCSPLAGPQATALYEAYRRAVGR